MQNHFTFLQQRLQRSQLVSSIFLSIFSHKKSFSTPVYYSSTPFHFFIGFFIQITIMNYSIYVSRYAWCSLVCNADCVCMKSVFCREFSFVQLKRFFILLFHQKLFIFTRSIVFLSPLRNLFVSYWFPLMCKVSKSWRYF